MTRQAVVDNSVRKAVLDELRGAVQPAVVVTLTRDDLVTLVHERVGIARGWSLSTTGRRVREALPALEAEGFPVISNGEGYRLTKSKAEADAFADRIIRQGLSLLRRGATIKKLPLGQVIQAMLPLDEPRLLKEACNG